jgi:DNA polymerase III epsilon subunit-like protein
MMEAGKEPILSANEAESVILANLWDLMAHDLRKGRPWVGHNIHGFDLPFCMRRSWLLQVDIPPEIRQGRYWHKLLIDTMAVWTCDSNREFVKLRDLAEAMNVGTKSDDGRRFSELWFGTPAERKQAAEYCLNDVRITAAVARKLGII